MTDNESTISSQNPLTSGSSPPPKKKRNLPGTPDPEAEVIALSPKTLMATNRFVCEVCGKGFQRDQNLQLHRRGHNLPWKLKQRSSKEARKRVYVCPEKACVHHHPSRALGDLTGIKKHFCRKHGEKKWKCDKCAKRYAVQSDWKAHAKTCGTREYKCDCGTIFSRRDSFITHRAFCDALAQETARVTAATHAPNLINYHFLGMPQHFPSIFKPINDQTLDPIHELTHSTQDHHPPFANPSFSNLPPPTFYNLNWDITHTSPNIPNHKEATVSSLFSTHQNQTSSNHEAEASARMSATALLQKAAQIGATTTDPAMILGSFGVKCNDINGLDGNRLCGLYSTSSVTSGFGSDVESSVNENSAMNGQLQMYNSSKRRRVQSYEEEGGETRDFLGVGINPICHPSSINGWI
ncbi:zinc finger protein NUTCRACKER-like [Salvia splendens]|uniref:zinc finger protein NUTCRACKER-like n=1 Tax=Salvia splendens TaxID=180675 RepID=UPI001C27831C|nr:zinc finger protein NUTCRACKER-like [Salvia splendens]